VTDIVDELRWRGLIAISTDEDALRKAFADGPVTVYVGFDPTAPSLHLGNLVQILTVRRLQQAGHRPLALVGGATGLIGDPKPTAERTLNDEGTVAGWVERIREQIRPYFDFEGPNAARMVNNLDWTSGLSAISLLRDVGKYFRVNTMITKEAVARRLNSDAGISYTEFSYQVLQGMDYLELFRRHGCTLQTGGSDQWGNITAGTELIRKAEGATVHALATPLLTKADGTKFGKTETGTVWLDPELTSPYAFYQFWLNADDRDVSKYLRVFSFASREQIEELERQTEERPQARAAQRALAQELTTLVHGADQTAAVVASCPAWTPPPWPPPCPNCRTPPWSRCRRWWTSWWRRDSPPASPRPAAPSGRAAPTSTTPRWPTRTPSPPPPTCCTAAGWCCGAARRTSLPSSSPPAPPPPPDAPSAPHPPRADPHLDAGPPEV
jgi:tyrosyl-tRNA synthetase